jgi:hypothetical protein
MASLVDVNEWEDYSKSSAPGNAETMLAAVSGAIRGYCGWSISREVVVEEEFDTFGSVLFNLPTLLLVSIELLTLEGVDLVADTDYMWSKRGSIRRLGCYWWPFKYRCLVASYTHGYEEVPAEIKALCVSICGRLDVATAGVLQKAVGGISLQFGDRNSTVTLTEAEEGVLAPYVLEVGRRN